MFVNPIYYEETLRCYNNLCHLAQKNNFSQLLEQLYASVVGLKIDFLDLRLKCLQSKKRFINQVKTKTEQTNYAFAVDYLLKDFDSWSNLCIKDFTYIYNENLKNNKLKGEENESNFD